MDAETQLPTEPTGRVYLHPVTGEYWVPVSQVNEFSTLNFQTGIKRGREMEKEASSWRPIETAPKDGDSILLLFQGEGFDPIVDMCFWDCYGGDPSWTLGGGECKCRFSRPQGGYTHWQPLPSTET